MKKSTLIFFMIPLLFLCVGPTTNEAAESSTIHEEIFYDILVDRFNNGGQQHSDQIRLEDPYAYHGGDIQGIIMKLDTLQEMGFTTISLSPIMKNAENGYHGYWIEDHYQVEEEFGTMDDVKELVKEAHDRDMKVMFEFVPNYVATSHEIASDPDKTHWLKETFESDVEEHPWLDEDEVVMLDQEEPEVEKYLFDVAEYWIDETDVDGFKIYAADQSSKQFLNKFTAHLKKQKEDFYITATVLSDEYDHSLAALDDIQLVENVPVYQEMFEVFSTVNEPVEKIYEAWEEHGSEAGLLYVDNKSTKRFTHEFTENGRNELTAWKLALTYMYTSPGVPVIYQGSEVPMYGEGVPDNHHMVDFNIADPDLKEFFTRISSLRSEFLPLAYGDYELIGSDHGMSVFKRSYKGESVYVAINNDSESRSLSITDVGEDKQLRGLLGDNLVRQGDNGEFKIGIPRESAEVYIIEENKGINWFFIGAIIGIFLLFIIVVIYLSMKEKKRS